MADEGSANASQKAERQPSEQLVHVPSSSLTNDSQESVGSVNSAESGVQPSPASPTIVKSKSGIKSPAADILNFFGSYLQDKGPKKADSGIEASEKKKKSAENLADSQSRGSAQIPAVSSRQEENFPAEQGSKTVPNDDRVPDANIVEPDSFPFCMPKASAGLDFSKVVLVDGSKLILRVVRHDRFQVDSTLRIIFSSSPLKVLDKCAAFSNYTAEAPSSTVVIDANVGLFRFLPIPIALFGGVIYTRDNASHIVVVGGGVIKRSKVQARNIPDKVCNKFICTHKYKESSMRRRSGIGSGEGTKPDCILGARFLESELAASLLAESAINPSAVPQQEQGNSSRFSASTACGLLFLRANPSTFRYTLGEGEAVDFHDGQVLAWTAGVKFRVHTSFCCYRRTVGAIGPGTIWICNARQHSAGAPSANAMMNG